MGQPFGIARELFTFFWANKRWWIVSMLVTLLLFGVLVILTQNSTIAPFIYTLF